MFDNDHQLKHDVRRLAKLEKKHPLLFARLADCYLRLGDYERAESLLKEGLKDCSHYSNGYMVLAEAYLLKGAYRDAEESCLNGLHKDPNHLGLLNLLIRVKKKKGNDWEVSKLQTTLQRLDPLHEFGAPDKGAFEEIENEEFEGDSADYIPAPGEMWKRRAARVNPEAMSEAPVKPTDRDVSGALLASIATAGISGSAEPAEKLERYLAEILDANTASELVQESPSVQETGNGTAAAGCITTRTLGELYAQQDKYDEAIGIYEKLIQMDAGNEEYRQRLHELLTRRDAPEKH